jgi:N-acetylglucosaminyl-diphospho-decaprenol L-rhamnosyltransferase
MHESTPDLSIVSVNYRSADYLGAMLDNLAMNPPTCSCEFILADNSPKAERIDIPDNLARAYHRYDFPANPGYAPAVEFCRRKARGRHLLFLNPDTLIDGSCLDGMAAFLDKNPAAGAISPHVRLYHPESPFFVGTLHLPGPLVMLLDHTCAARLPRRERVLLKHWRDDFRLWSAPAGPVEVSGVIGAIMAVRREVLDQVGGFDPRFFASHEDMDLCLRLRECGRRNFILKHLEAVHFHGQIRKRSANDPNAVKFLGQESSLPGLYLRKHFGLTAYGTYRAVLGLQRLARGLRAKLGEGKGRRLEATGDRVSHTDIRFEGLREPALLELSPSRTFLHKMAAVLPCLDEGYLETIRPLLADRRVWWRAFTWPLPDPIHSIASGSFLPSASSASP